MRRIFRAQRRTQTCHQDPGPDEVTRWDKPRSHQACVSRNEPNHRPGCLHSCPTGKADRLTAAANRTFQNRHNPFPAVLRPIAVRVFSSPDGGRGGGM
jgi:hypothetical protein